MHLTIQIKIKAKAMYYLQFKHNFENFIFFFLQLTELVSGSGVWTCPNKLAAAIKDAENKSRTVLAGHCYQPFMERKSFQQKALKTWINVLLKLVLVCTLN